MLPESRLHWQAYWSGAPISDTRRTGHYNEAHHARRGVVGLQAVQAQVTIDVTKITCEQFLASEVTDFRTLGIWLNGYANGARGKTSSTPFPKHTSV